MAFSRCTGEFVPTPARHEVSVNMPRPSLRGSVGWLICSLLLAGCWGHPDTPQDRIDRATRGTRELAAARTEEQRFYALGDAAKESFVAGRIDEARSHADELMALIPKFKGNWNYGNAIQDAHVVLGRIAVSEGRFDDAKRHLLAAGRSPGSPQMDSFGPNLSLAKDLLEKGERETVLEYFELCRRFWDDGKLDRWRREVQSGKVPAFGGNLVY